MKSTTTKTESQQPTISSFKREEFLEKKFETPVEELILPGLQEWVDSAEPKFKVKGLSASDLDKANFTTQIFIQTNKDESLFPQTFESCIHLVLGCIEPVIDIEVAKKLSVVRPVEFKQLILKIMDLTGKGKR